MKWLARADEALGRVLRILAIAIVAALALGLLVSVILIVAGLFRISPILAFAGVAVVALLFYLARNTEGSSPTNPGEPGDWY